MRFLVDNSVSWRIADRLRQGGHDAVHVRELEFADAPDTQIYMRAVAEGRTIITQDVDFGYLLANSDEQRTSVILIRLTSGRVDVQGARIGMLLAQCSAEVLPGTILVLTDSTVRIRRFG